MKKAPEMFTNVLFKFNGQFEELQNEMYAPIMLESGDVYKVKVVASSEQGLRGVSKDVLEKEMTDFCEKKFNKFKAILSPTEEDLLYELIEKEEETKGKKYTKKETTTRYTTLEEEALIQKVEKIKAQYKEDLMNGKILLQANAIFLGEDGSGLLQIPAFTTLANGANQKRNIHVTSDMILKISASQYDEEFKRTLLTFDMLNTELPKNIGVFCKFSLLNEAINLKYLFEINRYLINKLESKGIFSKGNVFDPDLSNLLYVKALVPENENELNSEIEKLDNWLQKFKTASNNLDSFEKIAKDDGWLIKPTQADMDEIRAIYEKIESIIIVDNKIVVSPKEYEVFVNVYFDAKKRVEFLKSIQSSLKENIKGNSLVILGKKDKKDYLEFVDSMPIEDIGISLKLLFEKEKDYDCNYVLNSYYHFPVTTREKTVQRIFAYSFNDGTYIPNYKTPTHSSGYIVPISTQIALKSK